MLLPRDLVLWTTSPRLGILSCLIGFSLSLLFHLSLSASVLFFCCLCLSVCLSPPLSLSFSSLISFFIFLWPCFSVPISLHFFVCFYLLLPLHLFLFLFFSESLYLFLLPLLTSWDISPCLYLSRRPVGYLSLFVSQQKTCKISLPVCVSAEDL